MCDLHADLLPAAQALAALKRGGRLTPAAAIPLLQTLSLNSPAPPPLSHLLFLHALLAVDPDAMSCLAACLDVFKDAAFPFECRALAYSLLAAAVFQKYTLATHVGLGGFKCDVLSSNPSYLEASAFLRADISSGGTLFAQVASGCCGAAIPSVAFDGFDAAMALAAAAVHDPARRALCLRLLVALVKVIASMQYFFNAPVYVFPLIKALLPLTADPADADAAAALTLVLALPSFNKLQYTLFAPPLLNDGVGAYVGALADAFADLRADVQGNLLTFLINTISFSERTWLPFDVMVPPTSSLYRLMADDMAGDAVAALDATVRALLLRLVANDFWRDEDVRDRVSGVVKSGEVMAAFRRDVALCEGRGFGLWDVAMGWVGAAIATHQPLEATSALQATEDTVEVMGALMERALCGDEAVAVEHAATLMSIIELSGYKNLRLRLGRALPSFLRRLEALPALRADFKFIRAAVISTLSLRESGAVDAAAALDQLAVGAQSVDSSALLALRLLANVMASVPEVPRDAMQLRLAAAGVFERLSVAVGGGSGVAVEIEGAVLSAALIVTETSLSAPIFKQLARVCDFAESPDAITRVMGLRGLISFFVDAVGSLSFSWHHYDANTFERALRVLAAGYSFAIDDRLNFFSNFIFKAATHTLRRFPYAFDLFDSVFSSRSTPTLWLLFERFDLNSHPKFGGVLEAAMRAAMADVAPTHTHFRHCVFVKVVKSVGCSRGPRDRKLLLAFGEFVVRRVCESGDAAEICVLASVLGVCGGGSIREALGFGRATSLKLLDAAKRMIAGGGGWELCGRDALSAAFTCLPPSDDNSALVVDVLVALLQPRAVLFNGYIPTLRNLPGVCAALGESGAIERAGAAMDAALGSPWLENSLRNFQQLFPPSDDSNSNAAQRAAAVVRLALLSSDPPSSVAALCYLRHLLSFQTAADRFRAIFDGVPDDVAAALRRLLLNPTPRAHVFALKFLHVLVAPEFRRALLADPHVADALERLVTRSLRACPPLFDCAVNVVATLAAWPEFAAAPTVTSFLNLRDGVVEALRCDAVPVASFAACVKLCLTITRAVEGDVTPIVALFFARLPHLPSASDFARAAVLESALSNDATGLVDCLPQVVAASRVLISRIPSDQPTLRLATAQRLDESEAEPFDPADIAAAVRQLVGGLGALDAMRVAERVFTLQFFVMPLASAEKFVDMGFGDDSSRPLMDELVALLQARRGDLCVVPIFKFLAGAMPMLPAESAFAKDFIASLTDLLEFLSPLVNASAMAAKNFHLFLTHVMCWLPMLGNLPGHVTFDKWLQTVCALRDPRGRMLCIAGADGIAANFKRDRAVAYFRKEGVLLNAVIAWAADGLMCLRQEASAALFAVVRSLDDRALVAAMDGAAAVLKLEGRTYFATLLAEFKSRKDRLGGMFIRHPDHPLGRAMCDAAALDGVSVAKRLEELAELAQLIPADHPLAPAVEDAFGRVVVGGLEAGGAKAVFLLLVEKVRSAEGRLALRGQKRVEAKLREVRGRAVVNFSEGSLKICCAAMVLAVMHAEDGWGAREEALAGCAQLLSFLTCGNAKRADFAMNRIVQMLSCGAPDVAAILCAAADAQGRSFFDVAAAELEGAAASSAFVHGLTPHHRLRDAFVTRPGVPARILRLVEARPSPWVCVVKELIYFKTPREALLKEGLLPQLRRLLSDGVHPRHVRATIFVACAVGGGAAPERQKLLADAMAGIAAEGSNLSGTFCAELSELKNFPALLAGEPIMTAVMAHFSANPTAQQRLLKLIAEWCRSPSAARALGSRTAEFEAVLQLLGADSDKAVLVWRILFAVAARGTPAAAAVKLRLESYVSGFVAGSESQVNSSLRLLRFALDVAMPPWRVEELLRVPRFLTRLVAVLNRDPSNLVMGAGLSFLIGAARSSDWAVEALMAARGCEMALAVAAKESTSSACRALTVDLLCVLSTHEAFLPRMRELGVVAALKPLLDVAHAAKIATIATAFSAAVAISNVTGSVEGGGLLPLAPQLQRRSSTSWGTLSPSWRGEWTSHPKRHSTRCVRPLG